MVRSRKHALFTIVGSIVSVQGSTILARLPHGSVGDLCWITADDGRQITGQIVAFQNSLFSLALFDDPAGIYPGQRVYTRGESLSVPVGPELLGRVINPIGQPLDLATWRSRTQQKLPITRRPPPPSTRPPVRAPLETGVRAIDGFCTIGKGQRLAICASAGVGKSTLLAAIARHANVDVIVVALVGERGREVREFIDETLGVTRRERSVVVVATSDDSSLLRQTAPYTATTIAEYFRDQGLDVLLIVDSLTRMARALRETSIAAGELPVRQGYTNTVYTQLPRLLERAGSSEHGTITGLYTVLTNQDDDIDPLADEVKSLVDGHIQLRHSLASTGVLPAIDVTSSISRLAASLTSQEHSVAARHLRNCIARLWKDRELVMMGAAPDSELQRIIEHQRSLSGLIAQDLSHPSTMRQTEQTLIELSSMLGR